MAVLITGGAGYIGSHVVDELLKRGTPTAVVDDLSAGGAHRLMGTPFAQIDLSRPECVAELTAFMSEHQIDSVIHFAAKKSVRESVARPLWYYDQNLNSLLNVIAAMSACNLTDIVFSSSSAVYGNIGGKPATEDSPFSPMSPYGHTKVCGEWILEDAARAHSLRAISLRFFNVVGSARPDLGDLSDFNLLPMAFRAIAAGKQPFVFGDDYPTPDGTSVRDYVHVRDVAHAHISALEFGSSQPAASHDVFNVGTGVGTSVKEMLDLVIDVSGSPLQPRLQSRIDGDPAWATANVSKILNTLGWQAELSTRDMVESAWESFLYLANESST
jgi:UDP-glucose 4-epimerase